MGKGVANDVLNVATDEIFNLAAIRAHEVVVIVASIGKLVERTFAVDVHFADDAGFLEGVNHAIDGHLVAGALQCVCDIENAVRRSQ